MSPSGFATGRNFDCGGRGKRCAAVMCVLTNHKREERSPLGPGFRACLRAVEAVRVFDALSCYLSLTFKHSDTKWDLKNS